MSGLSSLTRSLNSVAASRLSGNFNAMCAASQSASPTKSLLHDTGFTNAYSGNNVSQHQAASQTVGSHKASIDNINTVQQVSADANNYVQQVQTHLDTMVEVIEMAAEAADVKMIQAFANSNMGDVGNMTTNVMTAGAGVDAVTLVADLVDGLKEGKVKPDELQDKIACKLREMAIPKPQEQMTDSQRVVQKAAQQLVTALDSGHTLQAVLDARNNVETLPEVAAAMKTQYQAGQTAEANHGVREKTMHKAHLTTSEEIALGEEGIEAAQQYGVDAKDLANVSSAECELSGASVSGITKCVLPGHLCKQFQHAHDHSPNPVHALQAKLEEAFAAHNVKPPETAVAMNTSMGMGGMTG